MSLPSEEEYVLAQISRGPAHAARVADEVGDDMHARLAASRVRRLTDQHGCRVQETGACEHPNHRRDVAYRQAMLAMLGLDGLAA